jgi:hypothetical protein
MAVRNQYKSKVVGQIAEVPLCEKGKTKGALMRKLFCWVETWTAKHQPKGSFGVMFAKVQPQLSHLASTARRNHHGPEREFGWQLRPLLYRKRAS